MSSFGELLAAKVQEQVVPKPVSSRSLLDSVFDEEPVSLSVFVQDKKYLNNPPLSQPQYEFVRHFEQVYMPDLYPLMVEEFGDYWQPVRFVNFLNAEWGKGSGKDHCCRISLARVAYLLLCLKSPQAYYGMPPQDEIQTLNVAASALQAHRAFFKPLRTVLTRSPWFKDKFVGDVPGEQASAIRLHKQVELVSGHSFAETMEGLNLIAAIADEISAFKTKDELEKYNRAAREPAKSAEAILKMLRTSARTRFPATFKLAQISYPRFKGDAIEQAVLRGRDDNERKGDRSRVYVTGPLATWDVNPRVTGKEQFEEDYEEDPIMARAMYECLPDLSANRYFRNNVAVHGCFAERRPEPLVIDYYWGVDEGDTAEDSAAPSSLPGWQVQFHLSDDLVPMTGAVYTLHGDMAISGDRAGVAMCHVRQWERREWEVPGGTTLEARPRVKVDFVTAFESDVTATAPDGEPVPREVQIRWYRKLIFELQRRGFYIGFATFDNFQCLAGETAIPLLDGTERHIADLAESGGSFWVYSVSGGRVVPGKARARWSGIQRLYEVELDNGRVVRCSAEHRWLMRDGTYMSTRELRPGCSLMPLYRRQRKISPDATNEQVYEQVWQPVADGSGRRWQFTHGMVSSWFDGPQGRSEVVHHANFVKCDNRPENLLRMSREDHSALHASLAAGRFKDLWADPEWCAAHKARLSAAQGDRNRARTGHKRNKGLTIEDVGVAYDHAVRSSSGKDARSIGQALGCSWPVVHRIVKDAGFASWKAYRRAQGETHLTATNHTVVAVRDTGQSEDVYDLAVDSHENFALAAGVFVHNSADTIQILTARGVESKRQSTDIDITPWQTLRDVMYDSRLEGYWNPILVDELLALTRLANGKVDHPAGGSKDMADALAGAVLGAVTMGGDEGSDPQQVGSEGEDMYAVPAPTGSADFAGAFGAAVAYEGVNIGMDSGGLGAARW